jgi:predicted transcriptional regulator
MASKAPGDTVTAMTKLLEEAVAKVRDLPAGDQGALAVAMLSMAETEAPVMVMDEQTRAAIRDEMEQARRGEFVPDGEIEALWKQHDL